LFDDRLLIHLYSELWENISVKFDLGFTSNGICI